MRRLRTTTRYINTVAGTRKSCHGSMIFQAQNNTATCLALYLGASSCLCVAVCWVASRVVIKRGTGRAFPSRVSSPNCFEGLHQGPLSTTDDSLHPPHAFTLDAHEKLPKLTEQAPQGSDAWIRRDSIFPGVSQLRSPSGALSRDMDSARTENAIFFFFMTSKIATYYANIRLDIGMAPASMCRSPIGRGHPITSTAAVASQHLGCT